MITRSASQFTMRRGCLLGLAAWLSMCTIGTSWVPEMRQPFQTQDLVPDISGNPVAAISPHSNMALEGNVLGEVQRNLKTHIGEDVIGFWGQTFSEDIRHAPPGIGFTGVSQGVSQARTDDCCCRRAFRTLDPHGKHRIMVYDLPPEYNGAMVHTHSVPVIR